MIGIGVKLTSEPVEGYKEGTYQLIESLGSGRIAKVYKAEQTWPPERQGRQVAVKLANSAAENERLKSERKVLEAVAGHRGFPRLEGCGTTTEDGRVFLIMELVPRDSELVRSARGGQGKRLSERLGVKTALQYAGMLQALHSAGFASTDRKLDDIIWDDKTDPNDPRLIVLDWNVTAVDREIGQRRDLYQFGQFWHRLLLGTPPPSDQDRAVVKLEDHPYWSTLTYGTQQVLSRALNRVAEQRYQMAENLVKDLESLVSFFDLSAEELVAKAKGLVTRAEELDAKEETAKSSYLTAAMAALDMIRIHFRDTWPDVENQFRGIERRSQDRSESLLKIALDELRQAQYANAHDRLKQVLEESSQNPERTLRADRWRQLAYFGTQLSAEAEKIFRSQALAELAGTTDKPGIIENLEAGGWRQAIERFWDLLTDAFLGPGGRGEVPTSFLENVRKAREAFEDADANLTWAYLRDARHVLEEPRPDQATLFGAMIGQGNKGLSFLVTEAMMQETLRQAQEEAQRGDLDKAAILYDQAGKLLEGIPYRSSLRQFGSPDTNQTAALCRKLAVTLGTARQCLKVGHKLIESDPPEFAQARLEFERGLALFSTEDIAPEWARLRGEGLVVKLRNGQERVQRCQRLKEVLDTDNLEVALMRCQELLDHFPDDRWGQQRRKDLEKKLVDQIEEAFKEEEIEAVPKAEEAAPTKRKAGLKTEEIAPRKKKAAREAGEALAAAQLVTLAQHYFADDDEMRKRLPEWELRAAFALEKELYDRVNQVERELLQNWQTGLQQVLDPWADDHELLRQARFFSNVFDNKTLADLEVRLDALYERIRHVSQLQRDMAAEWGVRRAEVDLAEQKRREDRRQAHVLWQKAHRLSASEKRQDWQAALEQARQAHDLWPERADVQMLIENLGGKIDGVNRRFDEVLEEAQVALEVSEYEKALDALDTKSPPEVELTSEQQGKRKSLHDSIQREKIAHRLDQAMRQARRALANGNYEDTLEALDERDLPDDVLLPDQHKDRQSLRALTEQLGKLEGEFDRVSQSIPPGQLLAAGASDLPKAREQLERVAELIEQAPDRLPETLKSKFQEYVGQAESLLGRVNSHLHFWQRSLKAQAVGALALAGWMREQLAKRDALAPESGKEEAT